ncbi:MAG: hypothetical protein WA990_07575 [Rubrobacteraceae bacterium]
MIRERTTEHAGVHQESLAFRSGWKDGRFGQLGSFAANDSLAEWSELDRLSYYRGHREGRRIRELLCSGKRIPR